MNLYEQRIKGTKALVMDNGEVKVTLLPRIGGKIASIIYGNFEYLYQNSEVEYEEAELHDMFPKYDTSGSDDCFPNINAEEVVIGSKVYKYPDHGEIWTAQMEYSIEEDCVNMYMYSEILPYYFKKSVSLDGKNLIVDYHIKNIGNFAFPCIWTFHGLFTYHENMKVIFPPEECEVVNLGRSSRMGKPGSIHSFNPAGENDVDLAKVIPLMPPAAEKFYITQPVKTGSCGYEYPAVNRKCMIYYDTEKLPYLGLWLNSGLFKKYPNLAWEPTNGYFDAISIAEKNNKLPYLAPDGTMEFTLKFSFDDM